MATITYTGAPPKDLDRPLADAHAERPGKPIRIRVQPTILRGPSGDGDGQHKSWAGVSWGVECKTPEEGAEVRRALEVFFAAIAQFGATKVTEALTAPAEMR